MRELLIIVRNIFGNSVQDSARGWINIISVLNHMGMLKSYENIVIATRPSFNLEKKCEP